MLLYTCPFPFPISQPIIQRDHIHVLAMCARIYNTTIIILCDLETSNDLTANRLPAAFIKMCNANEGHSVVV